MTNLIKIGIVGRPNVGKSSIFNRFVGERYCIVDSVAGVTRNCHIRQVKVKDATCILMDTGGISDDAIDDFTSMVQDQTKKAMDSMDIILFVVDVAGLHQDDYRVAKQVRQLDKPILLVVNKCDNALLDMQKTEFYDLGFPNLVSISAIHGYQFSTLVNWVYECIKTHEGDLEDSSKTDLNNLTSTIKLALIGKPNAGKSRLMNCIIKQDRSLVSDIPGTTRDVVESTWNALGHRWLFLDTAGMRRRTKVHDDIEYYSIQRVVRSIEKSDIVIHLIDATENISQQDKKILDLCVSRKRALIIVINKWDLCKGDISITRYLDRFRFDFPTLHYVPVVFVSAKTGFGVQNLLKKTLTLFKNYQLFLKTGELNQLIQKIQTRHTSSQKHQFKIYYIVQKGVKPPSFLLFINSKKRITPNLQRYLTNQIRAAFGLEGIPIQLTFREKKRED